MRTPESCLAKAVELSRLAREPIDSEIREELLRMAGMWLDMGRNAEFGDGMTGHQIR
jgi:hypothetical protein